VYVDRRGRERRRRRRKKKEKKMELQGSVYTCRRGRELEREEEEKGGKKIGQIGGGEREEGKKKRWSCRVVYIRAGEGGS
jgi:hypothetical protein